MTFGDVTATGTSGINEIAGDASSAIRLRAATSDVKPERLRVQLIARQDSQMTGLRRYGETLQHHLGNEPLEVRLRFPDPPMPELVVTLGRRLGWDLRAFSQSYPLWSSLPPADLYHLTSEGLATLLLTTWKRPTVVTVHGLLAYLLRDDPRLSIYNHSLDRWFDSLAVRGLRRADALIAVSTYLKQMLVEEVGIPADRIHVIAEGVDHSVFRPLEVPDEFRRKYRITDGRLNVLYVGSEQPRKNFPALLRAFARVRTRIPDLHLWKVGQPEIQGERAKASKLVEQLALGGSVTFIGHVGVDLPYFYNASTVFVFPSLYEGFGFPPLEAMACGTPVICSNRTSLPEVVGDAALSFDPGDDESLEEAMERLLLDTELQEQYRQRGLERARRFRWDETARKTVDVYRAVLGGECADAARPSE